MTELPDAAVEAAARAVASHPWDTTPRSAHQDHAADAGCAVCRGDVPALVAVALKAAAPLIAEEAGRALAEAREEIEEDARVMRAWRRREAQAVARAKEAEAAIARVRDVHHVHRCAVDGHIHTRTPTPCVNDAVCECGRRDPCPTITALDSPEETP